MIDCSGKESKTTFAKPERKPTKNDPLEVAKNYVAKYLPSNPVAGGQLQI